jgi:hypothetical protein
MAFTFDADPVSATMNSYVSVSDADDFFTAKYIPADSDQWSELDTSVKEALLCSATRVLNTFVYGGLRTSRTQPLQWPRSGLYTDEGIMWSSATVAAPMKEATCEQAYWMWTEGNRVLDDTTLQQVDSFKAGPLDLKIRKNPLVNISRDALALINSMGQGTLISTGDSGGAKTMNMSL